MMAPKVTHFKDLDFVAESFDPVTEDFIYTTFAVVEIDDSVYFGQISKPKLEITPAEFTAALEHLPDKDIYPIFPATEQLTIGPNQLDNHLFLKRPRLFTYEEYKMDDAVYIIPALLLEEAHTLEAISKRPHPGIIGYHGCRVRRGFITGLILDRYEYDLKQYVRGRIGPIDRQRFMTALDSAARHVHSQGLAHNDINPGNILIDASGMPVLADFDSCRPVGAELSYSRGTPGWIDENDRYDTSEIRHDLFGIEKIREFLNNYMSTFS